MRMIHSKRMIKFMQTYYDIVNIKNKIQSCIYGMSMMKLEGSL